jgi:hypothetical protein
MILKPGVLPESVQVIWKIMGPIEKLARISSGNMENNGAY